MRQRDMVTPVPSYHLRVTVLCAQLHLAARAILFAYLHLPGLAGLCANLVDMFA